MLDLKFIRENPGKVKEAVKNRGMKVDVDGLLSLDEKRRKLLAEVERLKSERNRASREIGELVTAGKDVSAMKKAMKAASQNIKDIDTKVGDVGAQIDKIAMTIPNIPDKSVPVGVDAGANKVVREWGKIPRFGFPARTHLDIAEHLGLMDFRAAARISGHGFSLFSGAGARLERALINFMLDLHTKKHGYTEISPPYLVNRQSMTGTGQLPNLEEDMYLIAEDDLFLIPTAEVPVTNIYAGEVISEEDLPIYLTAYTACFRREAGSYGKDTRGLTRVHQFDKVELVKFVSPEKSEEELESLLADAEKVMQMLELPYRVSILSTSDMSFASAKCYDIEAWAPGAETYLEVSSCSNFESFQARRANIRYRRKKDKKSAYVHTLNGSGVALARTVICLLENHQQKDGSVLIPEALRPHMDGRERLTPEKK